MARKSFALVLFIILCSRLATAQVTTATISGVARDQSAALIPGVSVVVRNVDTGTTRTVITDDQGRYRVPNLDVGDYEVQASLMGFQTELRSGIKLTIGREAVVDFTLKVGDVVERVEVTGEAPLVDTTSSIVAGLVDDKQIRELPLNGRSFAQLALLGPGVNAYLNNTPGFFNGRGMKITANGARFFHNSFLLDGTDVNDMYNNTPGSVAGVMLGVETVREFKVMTHNFSAEYGRAAGAIINAVTQSGTNQLHGSLFHFHRNSALDAKNFFDPIGKSIPPFKRNQFGFTVGGPIKKEKTFFFGGYEGLRERLGVTKVGLVPDQNARSGLVPDARTGQLVNVGVAPSVRPYLDGIPLPNGRALGGGIGEYLFSFNQPTREDFFTVRMDHNISSSDTFFARYSFDDGHVVRLPLDAPMFQEPEASRNQYLTIEQQHIFSPTLLNTFRFGLNRSFSEVFNEAIPGVKTPSPFRRDTELMGDITIGGLSSIGTDFRVPIRNAMTLYEFSDDVTLTKGAHSIKSGALVKRIPWNITQWASKFGSFSFDNLTEFLRARPTTGSAAVPGSDVSRSMNQSMIAFYLQDDMKATRNLTLNVGLRYEFTTVPTEKYGRTAALKNLSDREMTIGPPFENPSLTNFAPRIGFAWDLFNNHKTSLRGGFGLFHDPVITSHLIPTISLIPPFYVRFNPLGPPFPNHFEGLAGDLKKLATNTWVLWPFNLKNPVMMHYNLMIEREILPDTVIRVGYSGSRGTHLNRTLEGNPTQFQIQPDGRLFFPGAARINPNFFSIQLRSYDANSFYNALLLNLTRQLNNGLRFQVAYTFGKSIDDSTSINVSDAANANITVQNPFSRTADRGLSNYDVRHNLTINYTYDLPFGAGRAFGKGLTGWTGKLASGWQMNGIVAVTSGNPFTVGISGNYSRSLAGGDRPNIRPGVRAEDIVRGGPDKYFDPAAFELQSPGFFGNVGRNSLIGPGLATVDASLVKDTAITEKTTFQFRAEFFNLMNHPNFATPQRNALSPAGIIPTAGKITRTVTTSRQIQFGAKVIF